MFKKIAQSSAIVLALTMLAVPVKQMSAQAPVVTGTNPMPTGEDSEVTGNMVLLMLAAAAASS